MKDLLEREIKTCVQYFIITLIAGTAAGWGLEGARVDSLSAGEGETALAINLKEMVSGLWNDYYRWLVFAFIGLSLVRLVIVIIIHKRATRI